MAVKERVKDPKERILSACVQMFIEKGYKRTTMLDIIKKADVSAGTFQNIFKTKDGVLKELVDVMYDMQFSIAGSMSSNISNKIMLYAVETSIQLTLVELNENLREIYVEAYTHPNISEYINEKTTDELMKIFGNTLPNYEESDFYEIEIGTSGLMRSFMLKPCDKYFTLTRKIKRFLSMSLSVFNVPQEVQTQIINEVIKLDITSIAKKVLYKLLEMLSMKYEFTFQNVENYEK